MSDERVIAFCSPTFPEDLKDQLRDLNVRVIDVSQEILDAMVHGEES